MSNETVTIAALAEQVETLRKALEQTLSFLKSIEWNDAHSEDGAADAMEQIRTVTDADLPTPEELERMERQRRVGEMIEAQWASNGLDRDDMIAVTERMMSHLQPDPRP